MARKRSGTNLPAPFLRRIWVEDDVPLPNAYPFDLPWFDGDFELEFETPVTIICGENGSGKSTLIEALAALAGYDEAGGGKGYMPVDHSTAGETSGSGLSDVLRAGWLPKVTDGWFFRSETFFSVARYLDEVGSSTADFLSHSHGEGYLRFFNERLRRQGLYLMDEPETALSPVRQIELFRLLAKIQDDAISQVVLATHAPLLMAVPGAKLLQMSHRGLQPVHFRDTDHFRLSQAFAIDPEDFIKRALTGDIEAIF